MVAAAARRCCGERVFVSLPFAFWISPPSMNKKTSKTSFSETFPQIPQKTPPHTPTPGEWRRMVIPRPNLPPGTVKNDVYYWTPSGKRMRSKNDVRKFLHENQTYPRYQALKVESFDFSRSTKQDVSTLPIFQICHFCYLLTFFWSLHCWQKKNPFIKTRRKFPFFSTS